MSLLRTLQRHFDISLTHQVKMLFSTPAMPAHGFPFTLLLAIVLRQTWLMRCNRRFQRKKKYTRKHFFTLFPTSSWYIAQAISNPSINRILRNLNNSLKNASKLLKMQTYYVFQTILHHILAPSFENLGSSLITFILWVRAEGKFSW